MSGGREPRVVLPIIPLERSRARHLPELRRPGRRRAAAGACPDGPVDPRGKTMELSYAGDVEFGHDAAPPSFDELHLRWYDRWLRGVDTASTRRRRCASS